MDGKPYLQSSGHLPALSTLDYVLFSLTLAFSAIIGVFYGLQDRNKKGANNFLCASGKMPIFPVSMSLLASFMSAVSLLGVPTEIYNVNTTFLWMVISFFVAIFCAAHIYIPIFYRLRITSIYEYLELRFSKGLRLWGSIIYCVLMLMNMAIVLYGPALALHAVTGFTLWGSVLSIGLVASFYTSLGGIKAVLWADTFQCTLIMTGLLTILVMASRQVGGIQNAINVADISQRIYYSDFTFDPQVRHSVWVFMIGGGLLWAGIYGTNQAQAQKAFALPTIRKAQVAIWLNFPGLVFILLLCGLIGILMYAFYSSCDPKIFSLITASDQLLPLFVMETLGNIPGVPGLFLSTMFSGTLSSVATGLNSMSAVVLHDFLRPIFLTNLSEENSTRLLRFLVLGLGLLSLLAAYGATRMSGMLHTSLAMYGILSAPMLGVYTLGMIVPWANTWGAYAGLSCSIGLMSWILLGQHAVPSPREHTPYQLNTCTWNNISLANHTMLNAENLRTIANSLSSMQSQLQYGERPGLNSLYSLSYLWYNLTAVLVVFIIGIPTSFLTGSSDPRKLDARLICPIFDVLCPYLPEPVKKTLHFGVRHQDKYEEDEEKEEINRSNRNGRLGSPLHYGYYNTDRHHEVSV